MANRLAHETSPYLLQHQDNPVDWYPWGNEALERAQAEDKPILLSIGYSACHWCHVMAHESFENPAIARLMNAGFVNVKVDREERPDLDSLYMGAVMAMTGQGGWPMTVALLPDGRPFFGGTYFPPTDRHGLPGFGTVLNQLLVAFMTRRQEVETNASKILAHVMRKRSATAQEGMLSRDTLDLAAITLRQQFDPQNGGFGTAPKFPPSLALEALLRRYRRLSEPETKRMVTTTLDHMLAGGMYDQLGGGFHRYSVDERWDVPHFEKMLYDNALLIRLYLLAHQACQDAEYRRVATETLDWVMRDLISSEGAFFASIDADSSGEEGAFYLWDPAEVDALLEFQCAEAFKAAYGLTIEGNFEGRNIPHLPQSLTRTAEQLGWSVEKLQKKLEIAKSVLLEARSRRVPPGRDEKVVTAWNGMMLRAFAEAARILERDDYRMVAIRNAEFLLATMREGPRLLRTYRGGKAKIPAFLEDYANVIDGLLALYEATFEVRWLEEGIALAETMVADFWEEGAGSFFDTGSHHEELFSRPNDVFDNATPAGNSVACDVLLRLSYYLEREEFRVIVERVLSKQAPLMGRYPAGFGRLLCVLDFALSDIKEVAILGNSGLPRTEALIRAAFSAYEPHKVVAASTPENPGPVAFLRDRNGSKDLPAAYVCVKKTCGLPITEPQELAAAILGEHG